MKRLCLLAILSLLTGCEGFIEDLGTMASSGGGAGGGGAGSGGGTPVAPADLGCDPTRYPKITLAEIEADFTAHVYPSLVSADQGCAACHGSSTARLFKIWVGTSGAEAQTFYDARTQRFFEAKAGSLVDRLTTQNPMTAMPKGTGQWPSAKVEAVARIQCELTAFEQAGGARADEVFPPNLQQPYTGPASTIYDNTFVNFQQLKAKSTQVFGDSWVRGGVDNFAKNIGLLGGVDFTTHFSEARVATPEFLIALDAFAPDICGAAQTAKTGPFTGIDTVVTVTDAAGSTVRATAAKASLNKLYQRMLYRSATPDELDATYTLLKDLNGLGTLATAWSRVCEALVWHPDFLFTLAPSYETAPAADRAQLLVVKLALDLLGRPPTAAELASGKTFEQQLDLWLASTEFRDYYFNRIQLRTESQGTAVTDEPARLWTYIAFNGLPFHELLDGEYLVDPSWVRQSRPAYHGKTGLLTMKGFINNKPGLPHYNYAARVFTDFMGSIFEIPAEVFAQRAASTASSTVDPTSLCFTCHQNLTPLATQRLAWDDNGDYRTVDAQNVVIDDSDRGMVATYAFKGKGMEAFATQAVKKEVFIRRMLNSQYRILMGRELRHADDERDVYQQLWNVSAASNGNLKAVLKAIAMSNRYQRLP